MLLEFAWAIKLLKDSVKKNEVLFELFGLEKISGLDTIFDSILKRKTFNSYYFGREDGKVSIKNISSLDAASDDAAIAEWGGISSFGTKASELVSKSIFQ